MGGHFPLTKEKKSLYFQLKHDSILNSITVNRISFTSGVCDYFTVSKRLKTVALTGTVQQGAES